MKPTNPPDEQPPHSSYWVVLTHQQVEDLLTHAQATVTNDKLKWVQTIARQFAAASNHAKHHGGFILLTDIPPEIGPLQALSLTISLDWVAYETLLSEAQKHSPAEGTAAWRQLAVDNLHALLLKQESVRIRKAAAVIWANFWREVQAAQGATADSADSPTP